MKRLKIVYLLVVLLSDLAPCFPGQQPTAEILPEDFSAKVFSHIIHLARLGHRHVGTENDNLAAQYIKDQFENMDIDVEIQPFEFESFEYTNARFKVEDKQITVVGLGFNPYKNKRAYEGTALLIDLNDSEFLYTEEEIEGKTIITNNWNGHFRLLRYKPELIIYVDSPGFEKLKSQEELSFRLDIEGEYRKYKSANIIGKVGNKRSSSKEVLITAHFDTYRKNNPGASDNASGVGVVLELARYFKKIEDKLKCTVKFIAFGGEEVGIIGSRNYLYDNSESLRQCELVFNIDDVGGNGPVLVEITGGVRGISETKCVSQIPENMKACSWEGVNSKWRMLADKDLMKIMAASNHPAWLVDVVNKSVEDLGYEIEATGTQGSDQLTFAQARIVTSGIGIISEYRHTSQDTPENINKKSLRIAGELAAHVVLNTLKRFEEKY
jgi:acetylornithine deacetylase/succinyl-diaminopimelate desuccinylase-like protein